MDRLREDGFASSACLLISTAELDKLRERLKVRGTNSSCRVPVLSRCEAVLLSVIVDAGLDILESTCVLINERIQIPQRTLSLLQTDSIQPCEDSCGDGACGAGASHATKAPARDYAVWRLCPAKSSDI